LGGSFELSQLGGLYRTRPLMAVLFFVPALSVAGIPPLSGFIAKLALLQAGLERGQFVIIGTALAMSLLTLVSVTKIWSEAFWKALPPQAGSVPLHEVRPQRVPVSMIVPVAVLTLLLVLVGVGAGAVYELAAHAADQLLNPTEYISRVLGH
jgi:multicomponent Na+:H+ antiporter subunit D